jgi:hypothetical protein
LISVALAAALAGVAPARSFQPDGLHLTFPGAHGFTKLLSKGLRLAKASKFPAPK